MPYIDNAEIMDELQLLSSIMSGKLSLEFMKDPKKIVEFSETYENFSKRIDQLISEKVNKIDPESMYVIADRTNNAIMPNLIRLKKASEAVKNGSTDYNEMELGASALILEGTLKYIQEKLLNL